MRDFPLFSGRTSSFAILSRLVIGCQLSNGQHFYTTANRSVVSRHDLLRLQQSGLTIMFGRFIGTKSENVPEISFPVGGKFMLRNDDFNFVGNSK